MDSENKTLTNIKQLIGYSVNGNMLIHMLVKYHNGIKLDVFSWVPISGATILDKYSKCIGKYEADDETCHCGQSQCQGCGYNFKNIKLIKIFKRKRNINIRGNFGDGLIKLWVDHICDKYDYNQEIDLLEPYCPSDLKK